MDNANTKAERATLETIVAASPLFDGLGPEHLDTLAHNARLLRHKAGETIVREADAARGFYLVATGRVKVYRLSPDGREQTLYHFGPGEPFCLCALFESREFLAHAAALETSTVLFIPAANLEHMGSEEPALLVNLLMLLARRLKEAMDMVESLSIRTLNERVALFVYRLAVDVADGVADDASHGAAGGEQGQEVRVRLPMTHRELSKVVGATPEALSRAFRGLVDAGVLTVNNRDVVVHDMAGLEGYASGVA